MLLLLAVAPFVVAPQCIAGTGGIFSSNNPRRKIQIVVPIETPTSIPGGPGSQVAPRSSTPGYPSSLGAGVLLDTGNQSGPIDPRLPLHGIEPSKTPSKTTSDHQGLSGSAAINAGQQGSVESFFQVRAANVYRQSADFNDDKTTASLTSEFSAAPQRRSKSVVGAPGRFLWHALDNMGVPMLFGKHDDDLDPTLRNGYTSPSGIDRRKTMTIDNLDPGATGSSAVNAQSSNLHKIPESELEGTDSSVKNNDQMP
jgi:hypothetical protein